MSTAEQPQEEKRLNFIEQEIEKDLQGRFKGRRLKTRFPPEPNGYLHIGHAKSICLNFGLAEKYGGSCNLRFDDTNPTKEEQEYVDAIQEDVRWLGYQWSELHYASEYFEQLYQWAIVLIKKGLAYVCDLTPDQIREYRGTLTTPGRNSPFRDRSVEENLDLFQRMRAGEFPDGARTLRAKIDMASPNLNLRDPVMYRIVHARHHRTGDDWCIYPMYDWAHGQSDSIEEITHSICTLEFEDHRPLYDWFCESLEIFHPRQIEFARLNLSYTVMSKRKLLQLVREGHVAGWDDPRMPTLRGLRRRGYTPESIRAFCERIGVAKFNSTIDVGVLENCIREHLNRVAQRAMVVMDPLKVVLTNYPADQEEQVAAVNNPEDSTAGTREVPLTKELYIERSDFMEDAPRKFFRLKPGGEVRLRYAYVIRCDEVIKDPHTGEVIELRCSYDPQSRSGSGEQRKVKGIIHWVSAKHAVEVPVRLYDRLFHVEDPEDVPEGGNFLDNLNPDSLHTVTALAEPMVAAVQPGTRLQFERTGYFVADEIDSRPTMPVFNRIVGLRDSWAKLQAKGKVD
ncbi:MAG: glutamine--tRNA ligase [Pirellulaceae bacterium]|nr:MAG: glutamine--tRNA ligase [Pirellulaceae bacterium]